MYAPCRETGRLLHEHGVSLATLESDTDIVKTHMFAFAITHELCFTNVLYMLELSGIPCRAADRGDDLFRLAPHRRGRRMRHCLGTARPVHGPHALGEGEEMVPGIVRPRDQRPAKKAGAVRAFIEEAVNIPGVYAPSLYTHDANGVLTPLKPDLPTPGRRIVADFDRAAYPESRWSRSVRSTTASASKSPAGVPVLPFLSGGRPVPPRPRTQPAESGKILENCLNDTGFDDVSFLALSTVTSRR